MYLIDIKNENFQKINSEAFFMTEFSWGLDQFSHKREHELPLINWVRDNFLQKDKNFIDIGSYVGGWSWNLANHVNHVYAFEPNIYHYNCLCANIFLKNCSEKITTFNHGLSDKNEDVTYFKRGSQNFYNDGCGGILELPQDKNRNIQKLNIKLKRLDDLQIENIGFMKIDVEGYEKEVLIGAYETLKNSNWPTFHVESWGAESDKTHNSIKLRQELFDYISSINYEIIPIKGYPYDFICTHKSNK